ncbi:MAG TPA: SGNH/GDSL hydrolase family protein [Streptosporangiaceae bacterium]|nr:SGNH/GDSL hydrolase family protein [Streptosporangiaceae bacterium]
MRRLLFALLVTSAAVAIGGPATAATAGPAAAGAAGPVGASPAVPAKAKPRDLTIVAPSTLYLSAPPYAYPGGVITYGATATLEQARENVTAVNPEVSKKPISPGRGFHWIGLKVMLTNTGSQDLTFPVPLMTGTDGQPYYGSDATTPGCAQLATFPPRTLGPGKSLAACDTYLLPDKVEPRLAKINIGFSNPAATGFWQISATALAKPKFPAVYAALGDSYSSGEGAGDYDANLEKCHRSADAWPRLVASELPRLIRPMQYGALIACSGATSQALDGHVEDQPNQLVLLQDVKPPATLLTITMGGNDVKFSDILTDCVLTLGNCVADGRIAEAESDIDHEQHILVADYRELRSADKHATIIVVGYPRLFPTTQGQVLLRCRGWLNNNVRASLNDLDADLNAVIHAAAAQDGLRFIDVTSALNHHEGCAANSWLYPLVRPNQQQSGHPTKPGQKAIAAIVSTYFRHL